MRAFKRKKMLMVECIVMTLWPFKRNIASTFFHITVRVNKLSFVTPRNSWFQDNRYKFHPSEHFLKNTIFYLSRINVSGKSLLISGLNIDPWFSPAFLQTVWLWYSIEEKHFYSLSARPRIDFTKQTWVVIKNAQDIYATANVAYAPFKT